eukprot:6430824-Amphidinium_carterae.2
MALHFDCHCCTAIKGQPSNQLCSRLQAFCSNENSACDGEVTWPQAEQLQTGLRFIQRLFDRHDPQDLALRAGPKHVSTQLRAYKLPLRRQRASNAASPSNEPKKHTVTTLVRDPPEKPSIIESDRLRKSNVRELQCVLLQRQKKNAL